MRRETLGQRARSLGLMQAVPDFGPGSSRARPMTVAEQAVRQAAQTAMLRVANLHPRAVTREATLAQQEQLVQQAETAAAREINRLADLAFERHSVRLREAGLSLENVRTGELATLTDRQVGEALAEVPGAQGLGEAQLRGILYAARGAPEGGERISIRRLFDMARSAAERNAVLANFARLMDQGVPGTYEVLRTMTSSRNNWRGGVHIVDYALNGTGGTAVARFEFVMVDEMSGGMRVYDIILADGTRIQGKDWSNWFPDSLRSQFRRDVLIMTRQFATPEGLERLRWVFRAPGPVSEAVIRETMRQALEDVMREFNLNAEARVRLRAVFDRHTTLIELWGGTVPAAPSTPPPPGLGTPPGVVPPPPVTPP